MIYFGGDTETCGLKIKRPDRLLEIALVKDDTDHPEVPVEMLPHFVAFVDPRTKDDPEIHGEPYALQMNAWILKQLCSKTPSKAVIKAEFLDFEIRQFFISQGHNLNTERFVLAGKNIGSFDYQFLPEETKKLFYHRFIDVGNLFIDWSKDKVPPDLKECKTRAGIDSPVAHDAYEDALDVIRCIRFKLKETK